MPDLKSELSKVLQAWDAQDNEPTAIAIPTLTKEPTMTQAITPRTITTNVTRETFNFVKANPGIRRQAVIKGLVQKGQKEKSVAAMVSQLLRNGNIEYIGDGLFATQAEYEPLFNPAPRPKRAIKVKKVAAPTAKAEVKAEVVTVSVNDPLPKTYATPAEWTVESVIGNLNVRQAMAVYSELRNIFGV